MKRSTFVLSAALVLGAPIAAAAADEPAPSPSPSLAPDYNDPAVHFSPPPGWRGVVFKDPPPDDGEPHPVAYYVKNRGEGNQRSIVIEIGPFIGTFDSLATSHESDVRKKYEGAFIDHKERLLLANGMPAAWLRASYGSELGQMYERYEYVVFDGRRSIVAAFTAHSGDAQEKEARAALSSLSVVVYPRGR
jgi:hypothetical protein